MAGRPFLEDAGPSGHAPVMQPVLRLIFGLWVNNCLADVCKKTEFLDAPGAAASRKTRVQVQLRERCCGRVTQSELHVAF